MDPVFQRDDEELPLVIAVKTGTRAVGEANIRKANGPQVERSESSTVLAHKRAPGLRAGSHFSTG
ncbi:hypothetical protein [Budvicia aquatica]|uniref:Uncharacterized protein n=1 Tax=Budvicia aquatica TaxID=82979 RepID=A0A2C6DDR9_9GAMM|nr:hypothetical protein [Budvicia aquatica]PHI29336.1 hypothetical protein CRN84_08360 [Budvicia aquatica]